MPDEQEPVQPEYDGCPVSTQVVPFDTQRTPPVQATVVVVVLVVVVVVDVLPQPASVIEPG